MLLDWYNDVMRTGCAPEVDTLEFGNRVACFANPIPLIILKVKRSAVRAAEDVAVVGRWCVVVRSERTRWRCVIVSAGLDGRVVAGTACRVTWLRSEC